jgi:hypothetical protein
MVPGNPSLAQKGTSMHAVFVNVTIDPESADEANAQLRKATLFPG